MRVVFMGTPEFAVPSLKALLDAGYGVVGVFTQPDRPVGRGHKLAACPVKKLALERGVPVYQFERLRNEEGLACLRSLAPDIVVNRRLWADPFAGASGRAENGHCQRPRLAAARLPRRRAPSTGAF